MVPPICHRGLVSGQLAVDFLGKIGGFDGKGRKSEETGDRCRFNTVHQNCMHE
jgi:hypothetical protein